MDFRNKRVFITGGAKGIGRAIAMAFAEKGAKVTINFRRSEVEAKDTLSALPGDGHFILQGDISKVEDIRQMMQQTQERFGGLDILINNAAIFTPQLIWSNDFEVWQKTWKKTLDINLLGAANMTYFAVQMMLKQGGGRIVNVSSRGAFRGEPNNPAYGASKAGLNAMSQSLAQALAPYNIFVGVVAPGFVATEMSAKLLNGPQGADIKNQSPLGRVAQPEEVAWAVLFLASEKAKFATGAIIDINGASYLRS